MFVNKRKIMIVLILLMILDIPYLRQTYNNIIDLIIQILIIIIYLSISKREKKCMNKSILLFSIGTIFSTLINFGFSSRLATSVVISMQYVLMFLIFKETVKRYKIDYLIEIIFNFFKYVLIIIDFVVIGTKGAGIGGTGVLPYYLLGNKFTVSYYHMLFIGLFFFKTNLNNDRNKLKIVLIIFSMFICKLVDCNTGMIGSLTIGIICVLGNNKIIISKVLQMPVFYIIFLILINILLIGTDIILSNEFVERIVVDVLKRNMTLTGRLEMFELSWNAFLERKWFRIWNK